MKKLIIIGLLLSGCGNVNNSGPSCTLSWSCGNSYCANAEGSWNGTGTFTGANDESDCLVWSTAFLNGTGYPYNRVGSCTCSN